MPILIYPDCSFVVFTVLAKGSVVSKYYRFLSKTGEWVWMKTRATVISNNDGKAEYVVCLNYVYRYVWRGFSYIKILSLLKFLWNVWSLSDCNFLQNTHNRHPICCPHRQALLVCMGSGNDLSPVSHQDITWINADLFSIIP